MDINIPTNVVFKRLGEVSDDIVCFNCAVDSSVWSKTRGERRPEIRLMLVDDSYEKCMECGKYIS